MTSDGGVMPPAAIETRLAIAHGCEDGDEDRNDLGHLRTDPGFKLACGRLP